MTWVLVIGMAWLAISAIVALAIVHGIRVADEKEGHCPEDGRTRAGDSAPVEGRVGWRDDGRKARPLIAVRHRS
ncbi:hypothetical protein [Geodermatophilus sp. URMC 64]